FTYTPTHEGNYTVQCMVTADDGRTATAWYGFHANGARPGPLKESEAKPGLTVVNTFGSSTGKAEDIHSIDWREKFDNWDWNALVIDATTGKYPDSNTHEGRVNSHWSINKGLEETTEFAFYDGHGTNLSRFKPSSLWFVGVLNSHNIHDPSLEISYLRRQTYQ